MLNIVCTSKPCDGLLYYSYEYCCYLNSIGINTRLVIVSHPHFYPEDYFDSITKKYSIYENVLIDDMDYEGITLIMGRSMMTLPFIEREKYSMEQLLLLHLLFKNKVIAVYSENHKIEYYNALNYFVPYSVVDLCDYDIYPNGEGIHFEKKIYFDIHKPIERDIQFKYLLNGTNSNYYEAAKKVIHKYDSHGILVYDIGAISSDLNNIIVPHDNLLGSFETYVYTKDIIDPAPRLIQECKYYNKQIVFESMNRGAEVYYNRPIEKPNVESIIDAL